VAVPECLYDKRASVSAGRPQDENSMSSHNLQYQRRPCFVTGMLLGRWRKMSEFVRIADYVNSANAVTQSVDGDHAEWPAVDVTHQAAFTFT
jgi:hypothetical protein